MAVITESRSCSCLDSRALSLLPWVGALHVPSAASLPCLPCPVPLRDGRHPWTFFFLASIWLSFHDTVVGHPSPAVISQVGQGARQVQAVGAFQVSSALYDLR